MSPISDIEVKNIDHLGIVAGLIDEIGIVETINSNLGIDGREKISSGTVVKAILINGLGFVSRPLYLFSKFFEDKGIETLLGSGVKSDYINDDKLGRVMDDLYKYGLNNLFIEIVLSVVNKFKIETKCSHLDATSFHLHGEYKSEENQEKAAEIIKERPIIITKGYSRDHRPDLKQCVLDLITSSDGDIPLLTGLFHSKRYNFMVKSSDNESYRCRKQPFWKHLPIYQTVVGERVSVIAYSCA